MKNKLFLTLIFIILLLLILSINNISSAFTFEIDNTTYDTDELGFETLKYNIVYKNIYNGINFFTSENKAIFEGANLKFLAKTISYQYSSSSRKWTTSVYDEGVAIAGMKGYFSSGTISCSYLDYDVLDDLGNVILVVLNPKIVKPYISNKDIISTGKFDKVVLNSGNYNSYNNQKFYLYSYYYTGDGFESLLPRKELLLDGPSSSYFIGSDDEGYYVYEIPLSVTGIDLVEGSKYGYKVAVMEWNEEYQKEVVSEYTDSIQFTIGIVTLEEKEHADRDKQLALQQEANNTSKGIFEIIKEVLSYLNPLSENFFVYKLIELLVESLINVFKFLFVPSEDYILNWISELNDWLSEKLGALYYPGEIVVNFLTRIVNLDSSSGAVIHWSSFSFMGADLISAGSYDLNSLLTNETLRNVHSIYLIFVDVILWLWLIVLAANTFVDVFGGKYLDDAFDFGYDSYHSYKIGKESRRKSEMIGFRK